MIEPTFTKMNEVTYHVTNACSCGFVTKADVESSDVFQWRQGAMAQNAFPYLSITQREALFISGICGFCWDDMFPEEDEDDGYEDEGHDEYTSGEQYMADYVNSDSNIAYLNR